MFLLVNSCFVRTPFIAGQHSNPFFFMSPRRPFHYCNGIRELAVPKCCKQEEEQKGGRRSFLSLEEAGLVEISGLSTHERFLCRLTISSLNLLRVISNQEGLPIEELNAGKICYWFLKDKLKREQDLESAVLQWNEDPLP